ncbi:plasma membrane calcium [Linnemannia exigua]|uniref:Plasma membrane calcium n=1 Tax=Linnemannia exigua TaxID=604196 RepID=A0AAD4D701_9FUNG|nr:plasma membrane calcium [Linnemannia exigua]
MDKAELDNTSASEDLHTRTRDKIENSGSSSNQSEPSTAVAPQYNSLADTRPTNHGPFSFTPEELMDLYDPKTPKELHANRGALSILAGLHTNPTKGLSTANKPITSVVTSDEKVEDHHQAATGDVAFADREQYHSRKVLPRRKPKTIYHLMWMALQEKILVSSVLGYLYCPIYFPPSNCTKPAMAVTLVGRPEYPFVNIAAKSCKILRALCFLSLYGYMGTTFV